MSLSGFIARHIEQPAARHSKPASASTLSMPAFSHCNATICEPGTAMAFTPAATFRPFTYFATSRKSERRPFVHEPRKATSIFTPLIGLPAGSFM